MTDCGNNQSIIPTWWGGIDSLLFHWHVRESNITLAGSHQFNAECGFEGRFIKTRESFPIMRSSIQFFLPSSLPRISWFKIRCCDGNTFTLGVFIHTLIEPTHSICEIPLESELKGVITRSSLWLRDDNPELVFSELKMGAERKLRLSAFLQDRVENVQLLGVDQEVIYWCGNRDINSNVTWDKDLQHQENNFKATFKCSLL